MEVQEKQQEKQQEEEEEEEVPSYPDSAIDPRYVQCVEPHTC